jgi:hypothetical protein
MRIASVEKTTSNGPQFAGSLSAGSISATMVKKEPLSSTMQYVSEFLDRILPLESASHADAVSYTVEIPTRYAKCFAILKDGRKVELRNCRLFVGWLGWNHKRSFLFRTHGLQIEIQTDAEHPACRNAPGNVFQVVAEAHTHDSANKSVPTPEKQSLTNRKFIAIDGSQIILAATS